MYLTDVYWSTDPTVMKKKRLWILNLYRNKNSTGLGFDSASKNED